MTAKDYFEEAVICSVVSKCYENLRLVANAEYFRQRAIYHIAKGLEALALEASDARLI